MTAKGIYRLPNGGYTEDPNVFVGVWQELARPIGEYFGWKLYAFDPSLSFIDDSGFTRAVDVEFARRLGKLIEDARRLTEVDERYG